jgi:hypothetical protein
LRSGFNSATREFDFYTDGDSQSDIGELPILLSQVGPATGLVNGSKLKHQNPAHRVWIGKVYNLCARLLFHIRIRDIDYQKTPCRDGHRRGTTSAVLVAARWPVLK